MWGWGAPILEFFGVPQRGRAGPRAGRGSQGDSGCPNGHQWDTEEGDPTSGWLMKGREVELGTFKDLGTVTLQKRLLRSAPRAVEVSGALYVSLRPRQWLRGRSEASPRGEVTVCTDH